MQRCTNSLMSSSSQAPWLDFDVNLYGVVGRTIFFMRCYCCCWPGMPLLLIDGHGGDDDDMYESDHEPTARAPTGSLPVLSSSPSPMLPTSLFPLFLYEAATATLVPSCRRCLRDITAALPRTSPELRLAAPDAPCCYAGAGEPRGVEKLEISAAHRQDVQSVGNSRQLGLGMILR